MYTKPKSNTETYLILSIIKETSEFLSLFESGELTILDRVKPGGLSICL